jgi:uncharacterized protein (DUF4213/DUF364 family)
LQIKPVLETVKEKFAALVLEYNLSGENVRVTIGTLTPQQAIGNPARQDYALLGGKEVMVEAQFRQSFGQAFTNRPQTFSGLIDDVLKLDLDSINNRAIFLATLNAVCASLGIADKTRHCRNEELEECGKQFAGSLLNRFGMVKIGMVGYQPAILDSLVRTFGSARIRCNDLDPKNIGADKFGIVLGDGSIENRDMIKWCDLALVTSSTNVNNTFDDLYAYAREQNKKFLMFGVTGSAIAVLTGLDIICPCGH